ncbi:MAG: GspE/PulE family protein, partial [Planctomycetota bacterium]
MMMRASQPVQVAENGNGDGAPLDLDRVKIDPAWALRVPPKLAIRRRVLPFAMVEGTVHVACASASDSAAMQAVARFVKLPVKAEPADPDSLKRALDRVYGDPKIALAGGYERRVHSIDLESAPSDLEAEDAVGLCDELMHASILRQASDIHIDPEREGVRVRFRVDGQLERYRRLPTKAHAGLVSRFKVLAGMDIAEKRAPQDGRFTHRFGPTDQPVDVRVATLPTKYGERMTLRLLALQTDGLTLEHLGMCQRDLDATQRCLDRPHGMMLVTGPTGSGKSTTLYAALRRIREKAELNIVTIEDPVEYDIGGVAQVEVDSADKVSFSKALRSVLRHDPDVVMIGEIRDRETADIAIKASLTGHLVLSTLHTNTAPSAVTRLADMGVERYLIGATLRLIVAQRLVRRLCDRCAKQTALAESDATALGRSELVGSTVQEPGGCVYCASRGFMGRLGVFEMLEIDEPVARRIAEGAEEGELISAMRERGVPCLADDAVEKLLSGMT